jgi:ATP-dependent helicase/nuclease subunit A
MYASAKARLGKRNLLTIHENFRCAPSIVRMVNSVFEDLIKTPDDGDYQPDYVPLHFGRSEKTLPPDHGVLLLYPPTSIRDAMASAAQRRTYESRCIAAFITKLVDGEKWRIWDKQNECLRPIMLRDIAILMRTSTGLTNLEDALRLFQIDYRVIGGKHFYLRQEVQELSGVLRAIDNPYDKVAIVAALRSPFFGISDEDLFLFHAGGGEFNYLRHCESPTGVGPVTGEAPSCSDSEGIAVERPLEHALGRLGYFHRVRNDVSIETLLRRLYEETRAPLTYLLKPNGEQRVANLLKVADTARALYDRGVCTLRGFVKWLSEREAEGAEESEAITVESGDDFVRLLTMHKAKGLEFPVVILADLAAVGGTTERFIVDRKSRQIAIRTGGRDGGLQTQNYRNLDEYENRRLEAEERRLLYVAMTRARDFLVIPAHWTTKREMDRGGQPKAGSLMSYLADKVPNPDSIDSKMKIDGMLICDTSRLDLEPGRPPAFRLPIASPKPEAQLPKSIKRNLDNHFLRIEALHARAMEGRALAGATDEEMLGEMLKEVVPQGRGAKFGELVHRLLEIVDWETPVHLAELAEIGGTAIEAPQDMIPEALKVVKRTLASDLVKRILRSDRYFKEVPFAFKEKGVIVEGKMDVIFQEDDAITIVDFKTDKVTEADLEIRAKHYKPQIETYARAVQATLGRSPREVILFFLHVMVPLVLGRADQ